MKFLICQNPEQLIVALVLIKILNYSVAEIRLMSKFKIPGVSFSLNRALGITQAKQKFARETGIPTSKAGLERKVGKMVLNAIFGKRK